jgi:hypothetical protein
MKLLRKFQDDAETRDAVKAFLIETVKTTAVTKLFANEPVEGYREAIQVIEAAFQDLDKQNAKPE